MEISRHLILTQLGPDLNGGTLYIINLQGLCPLPPKGNTSSFLNLVQKVVPKPSEACKEHFWSDESIDINALSTRRRVCCKPVTTQRSSCALMHAPHHPEEVLGSVACPSPPRGALGLCCMSLTTQKSSWALLHAPHHQEELLGSVACP